MPTHDRGLPALPRGPIVTAPAILAIALTGMLGACDPPGPAEPSTSGSPVVGSTTAERPAESSPTSEVASPLSGRRVSVLGFESGDAAERLTMALSGFASEAGMIVDYVAEPDLAGEVAARLRRSRVPDIVLLPRPELAATLVESGHIVTAPAPVAERISDRWPEPWLALGTVDGEMAGVPTRVDLKSLVWYSPQRFEEAGYEIPSTLEEFDALINRMIGNRHTPLCVGIESGPTTGWPLTDWVEDMTLRLASPGYYDRWVAHEVPFDHEISVEIWHAVLDLWKRPRAVYAAGGSIGSTGFADNARPLADGICQMHRQGSFFSSFLPDDVRLGPEGDLDVFLLPGRTPRIRPVIGTATLAVATRDAPEVWATIEYLASSSYAESRVAAGGGGFLSLAEGQDLGLYSPLDRRLVELASSATVVRLDGSDLMPPEVGTGSFLRAAIDVTVGLRTVEEALAEVEEAWPSG